MRNAAARPAQTPARCCAYLVCERQLGEVKRHVSTNGWWRFVSVWTSMLPKRLTRLVHNHKGGSQRGRVCLQLGLQHRLLGMTSKTHGVPMCKVMQGRAKSHL